MAFRTDRQRRAVMARLNPSGRRMRSWHTQEEHRILNRLNAKPQGAGADGVLPDGRKVEVRSIRADNENRYRLGEDTHKDLLRSNGFYYFVHQGGAKKVSASAVDEILKSKGRGWYKDRDYPHTFIHVDEVF